MYRNLLALEKSCKEYRNKFTSYVLFMDYLIDTTDDKEHDHKKQYWVSGGSGEIVQQDVYPVGDS